MNRLLLFWSRIRQDKALLLLCLLLAFFAWQGIRRDIGFEVTVSNIAVDVNVPAGWAVWEKSAARVNILFRGSREQIRYLNNEQLRVVIPVPAPERGKEMVVRLSEKLLKNPSGAKVVRFSPSEIVVKLDQESELLLPVKAATEGALPAGLEVERVICSPASVRVSGARQVLEAMENIPTEPVDLKNRQATFKESVPIAPLMAGRMHVEPDWVSVEVVLQSHSQSRIFQAIPVRVLAAPGERRGIDVQPLTVDVTVHGQEQRIEQLLASDLFAYVNCTELVESTGYDLPVVVNLPAGLQLVKTEPSIVRVFVGNTR